MTPVVSKLGALTKIRTGKLDANASSEDGEYPFFTCAKQPLRISSYSYDCECVLVAGNGDLNVKYFEGKFDAYQRTYILETLPEKKSELHLRYVYYFMEKYLEKLREQSIGGIIKYIKLGNLTDAKIPLPPLEEQKRIAGILDAADILRAKRREALAKLDDLLQSTFLDMFGDPRLKEGPYEKIPLGEIVEIKMGQSPPGSSYNDVGVGTPLLNGPTEFGIRYPKEMQWTDVPTKLCSKGDILFCVRGATAGRMNIANKEFCLGRGVAAIRAEEPSKNAFVFSVLHSLYDYFQSSGVGSTFINISKKDLETLPFPNPPLALQQHFAEIVSSVEEQKAKMKKHLEQLDDLFASLQQRAFRGDL